MTIPYTEENKAKILRVADALQGTCKSLNDVLQEEFGEDADVADVHIELLYVLDEQVMECGGCGWWCEAGELNDEQECGDCADG